MRGPLAEPHTGRRLAGIGLLAIAIMAPVTLPVPVLRQIVQERFGVSELLTSLFMSINMVGALLCAPLAGALADRFGRKQPLIVGALLLDAACFVALAGPIPFPLFMAIRFIEGCAHITALSILLMLASHALPADRRGRAMGVAGGCMMLGVALGAPIGGLLGKTSALLPLQVGGALALGAAVIAALALREDRELHVRPNFADIREVVRGHPRLLVPLAYAFTDRFTVGFFTTTLSLYLGRIHGLTPAQIGVTIAGFMLPFALLSYPFGRAAERISVSALMVVGSLLYGLGTMAVGFVGPPQIHALMFLVGVTASVMFVPSMVMTTELAPESIRATALGAFNAAGSLGFIVGPLVGGSISQLVAGRSDWETGYQAAFLVAGVSELVCVGLTLPFLLRLRRQRWVT